jgi:hypothetical protein
MPLARRIFTALAIISALIGLQLGLGIMIRPGFPSEYALIALGVFVAALVGRGLLWVVAPLFRHHEDNPMIPKDRR